MTPPKRKRRRRARIVRAPYLVELAKAGLIPAPVEPKRKYDVMAAVVRLSAAAGRPPSAVALARELGISRQKTSRYLAQLEAEGLLRDEPVVMRSGKWSVTAAGEMELVQKGMSSSSVSGNGAPAEPSSGWDFDEGARLEFLELEPWSKTSETTTSVR